jgi:hypothetical protein
MNVVPCAIMRGTAADSPAAVSDPGRLACPGTRRRTCRRQKMRRENAYPPRNGPGSCSGVVTGPASQRETSLDCTCPPGCQRQIRPVASLSPDASH